MIPSAISARVAAVWLLLAALVAAIALGELAQRATARRAGDRDARLLLPVPVDRLAAVEVADAGTLHRLERDSAGAWFYHGAHTAGEGPHAHASNPAETLRIERALLAFGRTRIERYVARKPEGMTYGVATPRVIILAYRANERQPLAQYAVGDVAPDTVSRYVDVVGGAGVVTIPNYQVDNLLALIRDLETARSSARR